MDLVFEANQEERWVWHCHIVPHATNDGVYHGGMLLAVVYPDGLHPKKFPLSKPTKMSEGGKELLPKYAKDLALVLVPAQRVKFWEPPDANVRLAKRYGIVGEPWVFLIDKNGVVRHIFVGFTERTKLEADSTISSALLRPALVGNNSS